MAAPVIAKLKRKFSGKCKQDNKAETKEQTETASQKIDILLDKYFKLCGEDNYMDSGEGPFLKYFRKENFTETEIKDELEEGFEGCSFLDCLMDIFPFDKPKDEQLQRKEIFDVIKHCYKYGRAPLPDCRHPIAKDFSEKTHQKHIEVILKILDGGKRLIDIRQPGSNDEHKEKEESCDDSVKILSHFAKRFPHNGLLQLCELIPRERLKHMDEAEDLKTNTDVDSLYNDLQKWTKSRHISIEKPLTKLQRHLFRKIKYTPILTALNAKDENDKINASPKPLQLALVLLINTISEQIITEFQGEGPPFICVDLNFIWDKTMYEDKIKGFEKKYRQDSKKHNDGNKFANNEEYKNHVYDKLFKVIKDNRKTGKYLLQIYLDLHNLGGKYPRICANIEYMDNELQQSTWFNDTTIKQLTDSSHPKYAYPLAVMHRRYKMSICDLECSKKNAKYMMISLFLFSITKDDWEPIYVTKMYLNYVSAIMRLHEEDIYKLLPRFFNKRHKHYGLQLEKGQTNDIYKERRKSNLQFDIDIDVQDKFNEYKQKK